VCTVVYCSVLYCTVVCALCSLNVRPHTSGVSAGAPISITLLSLLPLVPLALLALLALVLLVSQQG
jgi:hypothetical protein